MSSIPEIKMHERCQTCAFRAGTDANASYATRMKAELCIATGEPFLCHESPIDAWCAGVMDIMQAKLNRGELMTEPEWKRKLYEEINEAICQCEDGADPDEVFKRFHSRGS